MGVLRYLPDQAFAISLGHLVLWLDFFVARNTSEKVRLGQRPVRDIRKSLVCFGVS